MSESTMTADAAAESSHDHGHGEHHEHSNRTYTLVFIALVVLAIISVIGPEVGAALNLPIITLITAFGIAGVKAWLVIKHFMHLDVEKPIVHYFLVTSVVFMVLFFAGVAPDVGNHEGKNWENRAAKQYIADQQAEQARIAAEGGGHHGEHHDDGHKDTEPGGH